MNRRKYIRNSVGITAVALSGGIAGCTDPSTETETVTEITLSGILITDQINGSSGSYETISLDNPQVSEFKPIQTLFEDVIETEFGSATVDLQGDEIEQYNTITESFTKQTSDEIIDGYYFEGPNEVVAIFEDPAQNNS